MKKEKTIKEKTTTKKEPKLDEIQRRKVVDIITNKYIVSSTLLTISIFIIEMFLRFLTEASFKDFGVVRIFISSLIIGMSISWLLHFFKRIIVRVINAILIAAVGIYAFVELLLYNLIGFYMGIGNAEQGTKVGEFIDSTIISVACHSSVKAHEFLSQEDMQWIVDNVRYCDNPFTCPHGRPTIITYTKDELDKMFKRDYNE